MSYKTSWSNRWYINCLTRGGWCQRTLSTARSLGSVSKQTKQADTNGEGIVGATLQKVVPLAQPRRLGSKGSLFRNPRLVEEHCSGLTLLPCSPLVILSVL